MRFTSRFPLHLIQICGLRVHWVVGLQYYIPILRQVTLVKRFRNIDRKDNKYEIC